MIEYETTGRHGTVIKVKYHTYREYCVKCGLEMNPTSVQLWIQYTRQCGDLARFNSLFGEGGRR